MKQNIAYVIYEGRENIVKTIMPGEGRLGRLQEHFDKKRIVLKVSPEAANEIMLNRIKYR